MPRIFDNIQEPLLNALRDTMDVADHADFCVGYFNLRGWKRLDDLVEKWSGGPGHCCRLLVGMQRPNEESLRILYAEASSSPDVDQGEVVRMRKRLALEFREQLSMGLPTAEDESGLRRLARQIRAGKVVVKLFLRHPLHAKMYLLHRPDKVNPRIGFVGSSNLTFSGLSGQGELNVDVMEHEATAKLAQWFEERWGDRWCLDISDELAQIIEESWAGEALRSPYHLYLKMAYHLSREAREGVAGFTLPAEFRGVLFPFQEVAVKVAAVHVKKRGGVLLGDVVGLGKTLMATALARVIEDDEGVETLILCPPNLVSMWDDYRKKYRLRATIIPTSQAPQRLPNEVRHRLVVVDEVHNLRNRESTRWAAVQAYIEKNDCKVILLSATPYNKDFSDMGNLLRLFIDAEADIGVRPEQLIRELGELGFAQRHQCLQRSLAAFEKSIHADDWRELMKLFMVRRTRGFILQHYAQQDENGRRYLPMGDRRFYFPTRVPKTVLVASPPGDPYAQLASISSVGLITGMHLPRYGLGSYADNAAMPPPSVKEDAILKNLNRAGKRLIGFCRTGLYKRLESGGEAFLLSLERHALRNFVFLHALENGLDIPVGTQETLPDDPFGAELDAELFEDGAEQAARDEAACRTAAKRIYEHYVRDIPKKFGWVSSRHFLPRLTEHLLEDARGLLGLLAQVGAWDPAKDEKLTALRNLVGCQHKDEKVLVFTQYADTARYLGRELERMGVSGVAVVDGACDDPAKMAHCFSPKSNQAAVATGAQVRVLIATDVLSEGHNLQDAHIVVNYDLPWAIIRLVQRAGRVDRIGQEAEQIFCYSFLPGDGIEAVLNLRRTVRRRLRENAEVVGTDERFFPGDESRDTDKWRDIFSEKNGSLDGVGDEGETDLGSQALQIWRAATKDNPKLAKAVESLPDVVHATKAAQPGKMPGVAVFMRTAGDHDALAWVDAQGKIVSESQSAILLAAACGPDEKPLPRLENHYTLEKNAVVHLEKESQGIGGQLGSPRSARFRLYGRLKKYLEDTRGTLMETDTLKRLAQLVHDRPLTEAAREALSRQMHAGADDAELFALAARLHEDNRLAVAEAAGAVRAGPRIICSMGFA